MRFGKTFSAYHLAKKLKAKRVLVVTFKPAVEDAWQHDLESHVDFDGWQYLSKRSELTPDQIKNDRPLVYFGSFQDLLGRDDAGNIKARNEWLHALNWDLVIFDEYHFGAWRDTARELFEGEESSVAKKESAQEYSPLLDGVNADMGESAERNKTFCLLPPAPICTCRARHLKHWRRVNSSKSRFLTGRIPMNSAPKKPLPRIIRPNTIPTVPCRRCAC
jgi:hypothetical protein